MIHVSGATAPGSGTPTAPAWLLALWLAVACGAWPSLAAGQTTAPDTAEASVADATADAPGEAAAQYSEEEVKAAFLFHFATYAEWPEVNGDGEVTFAMLRAEAIARELTRFAEGRTVRGRPVRVRQIRSLDDLDGDEVLFIGSSLNRRLARLIESVQGPTLVVTDSEEGLPDGAMINFQLVDHRIRFEIALPAVQRVGLTLSSRLLSAAMRVEMTRCYLECRALERDGWRLALGRRGVRTAIRV